MITILFYGLIMLYGLLFICRLGFANQYRSKGRREGRRFREEQYTVVQPILSGDPGLKRDLLANLENSQELRFVWLVDRSDPTAQKIVEEICRNPDFDRRIKVLLCEEVPQSINPKIHKIEQSLPVITTPYMIVLDDDSVIDMAAMCELSDYESLPEEYLITGIPHNYGTDNFWSKLLAAFVNGNSLISYFTMAQIGENHSINGMFYILSVEVARKYRAFTEIKDYLCDDLALAEYLSSCGVKIVQSRIGVNVRTDIHGMAHYYRQIRRWMLFSSIYMKKYFSAANFVFVLLPSMLPFLLLLLSVWEGGRKGLILAGALGIKALILFRFRRVVIGKPEGIEVILYEIISDILLTPLFAIALMGKPVIVWRNKRIRVTDGKIRYE